MMRSVASSSSPAGAPSAAGAILWWLRRPGHERQLTDCLGELSRIDPQIAHGLAKSLLEAAALESQNARAEQLLGALPESLTCSREESTGELVVRERSWWRAELVQRGRLDWVFHPPGQERARRDFQLAVEVKIGAGVQQDLLTYHHHLSRNPGTPRGLLVLARSVPQRGLLDESSQFWLGAVLWDQVLRGLRDVCPQDEALAVQWPLLLDILDTRGDLGTEAPSWDSLGAAESRAALRRLVEHAHSRAEATLRTALAKRPTARADRQRLGSLKVGLTKLAVVIDVQVPAYDQRPVAQLRLSGTSAGIDLVSTVHPMLRPKLVPQAKRSHDEALRRLAARRLVPRYVPAGNSYTRQVLLPIHEGEIQTVLTAAVEAELRHIARSGILDADILAAK